MSNWTEEEKKHFELDEYGNPIMDLTDPYEDDRGPDDWWPACPALGIEDPDDF